MAVYPKVKLEIVCLSCGRELDRMGWAGLDGVHFHDLCRDWPDDEVEELEKATLTFTCKMVCRECKTPRLGLY